MSHLGTRAVCARGAADADPTEPILAGRHLAHRSRRDEDVTARVEFDDLVVDRHRAGAVQDVVELFLAHRRLVVQASSRPRRKLQLVDAERSNAERDANALQLAVVLGLDLGGIGDGMRRGGPPDYLFPSEPCEPAMRQP
jgi:hypothetical protein